MSDTSDATGTDDRVLGAFVRDLEVAGPAGVAAITADYARRYPGLAGEFPRLADIKDRVGDALPPDAAAPARRFGSGDRLGEFEIVRLIGTGGMGEVYEARQGRLDRTVAVKVVRRGRARAEDRRRFEREQRTLARLHQTHIVPIHAAGEDGDVQYFAMAFIRGAPLSKVVETVYDRETAGGRAPSLSELAKPPARPDPHAETATFHAAPVSSAARDLDRPVRLSAAYFRSVADVLAQAAEAVQYAHDAGVCHRDLKPSNLMVDESGHCWIVDFGLAGRLLGDPAAETVPDPGSALTVGAMGTPQYMAPEQHDGKTEFASDVWGLGATLYELLTLRRAFDGPTREAIAEQVRRADPRPVRELAPAVPPDLAAVCRTALRSDPAGRYPTSGALAADLRRWLNREPTTARPARAVRVRVRQLGEVNSRPREPQDHRGRQRGDRRRRSRPALRPLRDPLDRPGRAGGDRFAGQHPAEVVLQVGRGGVPVPRLLRQALQADDGQVAGDVGDEFAGRLGVIVDDSVQDRPFIVGGEWGDPGQAFVQDHSEPPDIRRGDREPGPSAGLLGGHVRRRPQDRPAPGDVRADGPLGQPEVGYPGLAGGVEDDVGRLEVSVDDIGLVGRLNGRR